jgi:hypothetical protein
MKKHHYNRQLTPGSEADTVRQLAVWLVGVPQKCIETPIAEFRK